MKMEDVEFVKREPIDKTLDVLQRIVMPGDVEHHAAPAEAREVGDACGRQHDLVRTGFPSRQKLEQGAGAVKGTSSVLADDANRLRCDRKPVAGRREVR